MSPRTTNRVRALAVAAIILGCSGGGGEADEPQSGPDAGRPAGDAGGQLDDTGGGEPDDTGSPDPVDAGNPCDGGCAAGRWSECTCASSDPCGWAGDGLCQGYCIELGIVTEMFDDNDDCEGPCTGLCARGVYVPCTCGVDDPCGWAGDGRCDEICVEGGFVEEMFDDGDDCADP
jgi:hypothetical protein